jgi:hypothetical protein
MLKLDVIYSIVYESYTGKTGTTYRTCFSPILTFHHGRYKSFIDGFFYYIVFVQQHLVCTTPREADLWASVLVQSHLWREIEMS